jgi:hypothetical protein
MKTPLAKDKNYIFSVVVNKKHVPNTGKKKKQHYST